MLTISRLAYRDREFDLGLTLLETSSEIFSRFWSGVTGEEKAKDEERTRTKFLHASIGIAIDDFDMALEHIQGAIDYLDHPLVIRSEAYKGREWLLWGCKAEALDGKGCYDLAESHYRKALSLMPADVKYTKYHVGLGRSLLSQGKTEEGRLHLQSFLIELEEKFDVDNEEFPLYVIYDLVCNS
jgi:tetratricopeptide (TPR) repeat protein